MLNQCITTGVTAAVGHSNGLGTTQYHNIVSVEIRRKHLEVICHQIFANKRLDRCIQQFLRCLTNPLTNLIFAKHLCSKVFSKAFRHDHIRKRDNYRIVADGIDELISKVRLWNYELLISEEAEGERRKQIMEDTAVLDELEEMISDRTGYPLGNLTVKELIAVLSKMPEDYRVTCCGAENYLYLFAKDKYITIDNERWLC